MSLWVGLFVLHGYDCLLVVLACESLHVKLQALVYDVLPLEEGAGKRCLECAYMYAECIWHCEHVRFCV